MNWAQRLSNALPELARRAGRDVVAGLAAELEAQDRDAEQPAVTLVRTYATCVRRLIEIESNHDERVANLDAGRAGGAERAAVEELIAATIPSGDRAAWNAAHDRNLDASALLDRWARELQLATQRVEFLAIAAVNEPVDALGDLDLIDGIDATQRILSRADRAFTVRVASVRLLGELVVRPTEGAPGGRQALLNLVWAESEDVWVRSEALEAYLPLLDQPDDVDVLLDGILSPRKAQLDLMSADAAFLRARAARIAADHASWAVLRRAVATRSDPSEHVRIEVVRALARSPDMSETTALAQAIAGPWRDPSERVQAAAVIAALPESVDAPAHWIPLLYTCLTGEIDGRLHQEHRPSPWVVETVLEAFVRRCRADLVSTESARQCLAACGDSLDYWRQVRIQADLADHAAWTLLWLQVQEDDTTRAAWEEIRDWAARSPEGATRAFRTGPTADLDERQLLDAMALVAAHGFDLSAERGSLGDYVMHQGTEESFSPWRVAWETMHPRPDKRQGHTHVVDRIPAGHLVALSHGLSEVTPTSVPGRRVGSPTQVAWGAELPLPSHLVAAAAHGALRVRTPRHAWFIRSTLPRPLAWVRAHASYAETAELRDRLLAHPGLKAIEDYDRALHRMGFEVVRRPVEAFAALPLFSPARFASEVFVLDGNTIGQLGFFVGVASLAWAGSKVLEQREVRASRRKLPLVIGGWGSRGKSGSERLKAAFFHGLGYSVVAKTTGCEAMIVTSIPGRTPTEIPLYRPYDKATIVEQKQVMATAGAFSPQVFLWECMGLRTEYVDILQQDWMRDDFTTLTNTYPDHEDIQGPTGVDVARSIGHMIGPSSEVLTTEQHMLPFLEARAREAGAPLLSVAQETWRLLPRDLLARFPYAEHPRNIAMVLALADRLGVPTDVALKAAADHVVPDLGVLKTWGPFPYAGRQVSFINGCSANERAGFLSNWRRMAFDRVEPGSGLLDWSLTLVNNRADRPARQEVFAQIVALDVSSDAVAVIGTNVGPFTDAARRSLRNALRKRLDDEAARGRPALVRYIADRLRRHPMDEEAARNLLTRSGALDEMAREQALREAYGTADPLGHLSPLAHNPSRADVAHRWVREVAWLHHLQVRADWDVEAVSQRAIAILDGRLHPLMDSTLNGDAVLDHVAHIAPPYIPVRIMGAANIKGTGFGFVMRCLSVDRVQSWCRSLQTAEGERAAALLRQLGSYDEYGAADARIAADRVRELYSTGRFATWGLEAEARQLADQLETEAGAKAQALAGNQTTSSGTSLWRPFTEIVDGWRRRREADALFQDLGAGLVGMERAAKVSRAIMDRQKG